MVVEGGLGRGDQMRRPDRSQAAEKNAPANANTDAASETGVGKTFIPHPCLQCPRLYSVQSLSGQVPRKHVVVSPCIFFG